MSICIEYANMLVKYEYISYNTSMNSKSTIHLLEFTVENFRSIREPVTLSLLSTRYHDRSADFRLEASSKKALSSIVLYGANASGKSNALRALFFFWRAVVGHSSIFESEKNIPFLLDDSSKTMDSAFEACFEYQGKMYIYGFKYSSKSKEVTKEWLRATVTSSKHLSKIYERDRNNVVVSKNLPLSTHGISRSFTKQLKANELFIATLSENSVWTLAKDVVDAWEHCHVFNTLAHDPTTEVANILYETPNSKALLLPLMQEADMNIADIKVTKDDSGNFEIKLGHIYTTRNSVKNVWFDIDDQESAGTRKFFSFALPLLLSLRDGTLVVLDELGSTLHPDLLRFVVGLFNNKKKNPHHAQLILTTHDTSLLRTSFARDQIYFTHKNIEQSTQLYSLVDIKGVRKDLSNLDERYLRGDFGAVPNIIHR